MINGRKSASNSHFQRLYHVLLVIYERPQILDYRDSKWLLYHDKPNHEITKHGILIIPNDCSITHDGSMVLVY